MQTFVIVLIVVVALGFVARRAWKTLRPAKAGCGDGCGCGSEGAGATGDWAKT